MLLVAVSTNTMLLTNASAVDVDTYFVNTNGTILSTNSNTGVGQGTDNTEWYIHAGSVSDYPSDIPIYIQVNDWTNRAGIKFRFTEYLNGVQIYQHTPTPFFSDNFDDFTVQYGTIRMNEYNQNGSNAVGQALFRPNDTKINSIMKQNVRYKFEVWHVSTPQIKDEVNLYISRNHLIGIIWNNNGMNANLGINNQDVELFSGEYRNPDAAPSAQLYAEPRAWGFSTFTDDTKVMIRATEQHGNRAIKSAERSGGHRVTLGQNVFQFGTWYIFKGGATGLQPPERCNPDSIAVYVNCYQIAFQPNKTAIDSLTGSVSINLEMVHVENGVELVSKKLSSFVIYEAHTNSVPRVSLELSPETADGIDEGETAQVYFVLSKPLFSSPDGSSGIQRYLRFRVNQIGEYLDPVNPNGFTFATSLESTVEGNRRSGAINIHTIDDDFDEQNGSITVTLSNQTTGFLHSDIPGENSKTFVIRDNDLPEITINPHRLTNPDVLELPTSYAYFEITSDQPPAQRLVIPYEFVGTPYRDTDVTPPGSIIIEAGKTSGILRIKTAYNASTDSAGTISVRLKPNLNDPGSYKLQDSLAERTATVNVLNNNTPLIFSSATTNFNVAEDVAGGNFVLNFELSRAAIIPTRFMAELSSEMGQGKATLGTDFLALTSSEYQIEVGNRTTSISIPILNDIEADGDETFTLTLSNLVGANFTNNVDELDYEITIIDEEEPILTLAQDSVEVAVTESDVDQNVQVILNLSGVIDSPVNVSYSLVDETATGGVDYTDVANGLVTIQPNTTSIPINLRIKGDEISEDYETFKVRITSQPLNAVFDREVTELEATVTITDDEPNVVRIVNPVYTDSEAIDYVVAEDVVNGIFAINLESTKLGLGGNNATSFLFSTSTGTAIKDVDFQTNEFIFRGPRQNFATTSKTSVVKIPILNDVLNEGNETFNVRIHDLQNATFLDGTTDKTLNIKIIDDEKPELTFANNTKTVAETDVDSNIDVMLNLSGPIDDAVDITYEIIAESATEGVDYIDVGNGSVTIPADLSSIPIRVQVKGDSINEGSETFKIRITEPPANAAFADGVTELEATITITDDEMPVLSVDRSTLTISESAGTTHIGLNLSGPTSGDVVVTYSTSIEESDSAQQVDFTAQSSSTVPISSDSTTGTISIPITSDNDTEENETFTVTLSSVSGAVFSGGQSNIVLPVTIIDDEGLPTLTIGSQSRTFNEETALAEIVLNLSTAPTETVSVTYSTAENTATEDVDYAGQTNETLVITSGTVGRIYIPIFDDNIHEGNETFTITISQISGAAYASGIINTPINITIMDNETEPTLTISALSCEDSEPIPSDYIVSESAGNMIFNATLSHPSTTPVNIYLSTKVNIGLNNFATREDFYVSNSIQHTIHPGTTCTEILLPIINDELNEDNETGGEQFEVYFKNQPHDPNVPAELNNTSTDIIPKLIAKINDDDPVTWNIEDLSIHEGDTDTPMLFRAYFETPRPLDLGTTSATWTVSTEIGDTATLREDYAPRHNLHTGSLSIRGQRDFTLIGEFDPRNRIETTGDTIYEPDETFTVTLSNTDRFIEVGDGVATGTILNDDPKPTLSTSTTANVNEADDNLEIVVNLSNQSVEEITLDYNTADGTAIGGTDYTAQTNQTLTIPPLASSAIIKIPVMDDDVYEGLETFTVTLSDVNNATFPFLVETIEINVSIIDSKTEPEITLANLTPTVSESTRSATLTVNLNHASTQAISLKYETSDRTATSTGVNADFFGLTNQSLNFAPGEITKNISITINQDSLNEGNERFTVTLRQTNNATFPNSASILIATVTIVDDDAPTLSFQTTNFSVNEGNTTFNVNVVLSEATTNPVSFAVELGGGTAARHADYAPFSDPTITITSGTTATIPITILADTPTPLNEGNETVNLILNNLSGAIFANNAPTLEHVITILDSQMPLVRMRDQDVIVSEEDGFAEMEIYLSGPTTNIVTVPFATRTSSGQATAGLDFIAPVAGSNRATIQANQLTGTFRIPIIDDNIDEPNESFTVETVNDNVQNAALLTSEITVTIVDNDAPELSIAAGGNAKEGVNATANFTITANKMPHQGLTIYYTPVSDFFLPAGVTGNQQSNALPVVFSQAPNDGPITGTLRVPIDNDGFQAGAFVGGEGYEQNGTIMVTLQEDSSTSPGYTVHASNNSAIVHVEDDDTRVRLLTISAPSGVAESSGVAEFTITAREPSTNLTSQPFRDITLHYTAEEVDNGDFLLNPGVRQTAILKFGTQRVRASLPISLDNDSTPESTGKIKVTLHEDTAVITTYTLPSDVNARSAEATILDDDAPVLTIEAGNAVTEGPDVKARFKIISDVMPNTPIPIIYTPVGPGFIDGSGVRVTATPPINFTQNVFTEEYEAILEFDIMNDRINEPNGNVSVTLHNESPMSTYALGATNTASIAITDNDPVPTILIANQSPRVNEDTEMITIPVQLTNPTSESVEITWTTTAGTASTSDFESKSQTLEIEDGVLGLIQIPITDDDVFEGNESFSVTLNEPTQARFLNSLRHPVNTNTVVVNVTIIDNEVQPVVKFDTRNVTVLEDSGEVNFEFNLTEKSISDVTVSYVTNAGTATAGSDFTAVPASPASTAMISAGELTGSIRIPILSDEINEGNETFSVILTNPQNAVLPDSIVDSTMTVTITDQDLPILSISASGNAKEAANATADFTITADIMPIGGLTLYYLPENSSFLPAGITNVQQSTAQPITFTQADNSSPIIGTLSVSLDYDAIAEANETLKITLQSEPTSNVTYLVSDTNNVATIIVEDGDAKVPVLIVEPATAGTAENADAVEFKVTAFDNQAKSNSIDPGRPITVHFTPAEVDTGDFLTNAIAEVADSAELTFTENNGLWTGSFAVELDDDSTAEATGKVSVTLNEDPSTIQTYIVSTGDDNTAEATIWDDEAPELMIVAGASVTEGIKVKATFKIVANVRPRADLAVRYTPDGANYITGSGTEILSNPALSFLRNGQTGQYESEIEFDIVDNNISEPNGNVTVTLNDDTASPKTYYVGTPASDMVTVVDDEPVPTVSVADLAPSIAENGTSISIPVTISSPSAEPISIEWSTFAGTASTDDFGEQENQTLEIAASTQTISNTSGMITITIEEDDIAETAETFEVRLTGVTNATFATGETNISVMITITDNDSDPTLTIASTVSIAEGDGNASISATLSHASGSPVTFEYTTATGTASDADFTEQTSTLHTIAPGTTTPILIPITPDEIDESDEQFTITYENLTGATFAGGTAPTTTITITDDDQSAISIADSSVTEGDSGSVNMVFNVTLDKTSSRTTTAIWTASTESDNDAISGTDYANTTNSHTGSLEFLPGETSKMIRIPIAGDAVYEGHETFTVTLSSITGGAEIADAIAIGTIMDNEQAPTLSATAPSTIDEDAGELTITTTLSGLTDEAVTVSYSTADGTATGTGDDADFVSQTNQTHTIPANTLSNTFTIDISDDQVFEGDVDETFSITLNNANNATISGNPAEISLPVTITDNESTPVISFENTTTRVTEDGGTQMIRVVLSNASTEAISARFSTTDGVAISSGQNADFVSQTNQPLNFAPGTTSTDIAVEIKNEGSDVFFLDRGEGNEDFNITISSPTNATFANSAVSISAKVIIVDEQVEAPILSVSPTANLTPTESNNTNFEIELTLDEDAPHQTTFEVTLGGGTATKNVDYTDLTKTRYSIARFGRKLAIPIQIRPDNVNEGNETFELTISNLVGSQLASGLTLTQTITIVDDEMPIIKFANQTATIKETDANNTVDLEVSLSGFATNSSNPVTFQYATSTGTGTGAATADVDFTAVSAGNPETIPADQLTHTFQIPILGDNLDEPNESFTVTISNPQHAVLSNTPADLTITVTIEDDDIPELEISAGTQITEGDNVNAEFTITSDMIPLNNFVVHYLPVSEGFLSPAISNKPQVTSQPVTFTQAPNNGPITATLSLPIVSDEIAEANGSIAVTLQPPPPSPSQPTETNYLIDATNNRATLIVLDDDSMIPVFAITRPTENIAESDGTVEFTITAYEDQAKTNSIDPGRSISIQYTPENLATGNFLLASGTAETTIVNFNERDGIWTDTFSVTIDDDSTGEATGRIKVTLNDDPATNDSYTVSTGDDKAAEVSIWDDDAPELSIVSGPNVTPGPNAKATFKVISNVRPSAKPPLQYTPVATNNLIANSGTKVSGGPRVSFELNPETGKYEGTIEIDLINTDLLTSDGTVTVTLNSETNPTNYYVVAPTNATVIVEGDNSLPIIQVADLNPTIAENATSITIPVRLSKPIPNFSTVKWHTTLGTASANDFVESSEKTQLRFETSTTTQKNVLKEITIDITDDKLYEGNESFTVTLSEPLNSVLPGGPETPLVITVTIVDDEPTPKVKFTSNNVVAAENIQGGNVSLMISIDESIPNDISTANNVTVTYATSTGTRRGDATADVDFTATSSGTGTILAGQRTGTIQIPIINDILDEEPETFDVTISNPQNAVLSETTTDLSVNVTINDEDLPEFSITADGTYANESSGMANFIIESNVLPANRFTIKYLPVSARFLPAGVSNVEQTTSQSQPLSFTAVDADDPTNTRVRAPLSLPIHNDETVEANGTFMVTLRPEGPTPLNYLVHPTNNSATIDIIDDDAPIPILAITAPAGGAAESDDEVTFTVTAYDNQAKSNSINPGRNITIQYTPNEFRGDFLTNAVAGTAVTEELTFTDSDNNNIWTDTFTVTLDDDLIPEPTGAIRVTLNADPGTYTTYILSTRGDHTADATIWDDERPELSLVAGSAVTEGTDVKASFKVISNVVPKADLSIEYTPVGASFISGSGTKVSKTIRIADFELNASTGQYEEVIEIDVTNDTLEEPDGHVAITLHGESPPATYYVGVVI